MMGRIASILACVLLLCAADALAAPPPNDNYTNATRLSGSYVTFTGTLAEATLEYYEFQWTWIHGNRSVWWTWTAVDASPVTVYVQAVSAPIESDDGLEILQLREPFIDFLQARPTSPVGELPIRTVAIDPYITFV